MTDANTREQLFLPAELRAMAAEIEPEQAFDRRGTSQAGPVGVLGAADCYDSHGVFPWLLPRGTMVTIV